MFNKNLFISIFFFLDFPPHICYHIKLRKDDIMKRKAYYILNITEQIVTIYDNLFTEGLSEKEYNKWKERYNLITEIEESFYNSLSKEEASELYELINNTIVKDMPFEMFKKYINMKERIKLKLRRMIGTKQVLNDDEQDLASILPNIPIPKLITLLEALETDKNLIMLEKLEKENPNSKSRFALFIPSLEKELLKNNGLFTPNPYLTASFTSELLNITKEDYNNIKNYYYLSEIEKVLIDITYLNKTTTDTTIKNNLMKVYLEDIKTSYTLLGSQENSYIDIEKNILDKNNNLQKITSPSIISQIKRTLILAKEERKKRFNVSLIPKR